MSRGELGTRKLLWIPTAAKCSGLRHVHNKWTIASEQVDQDYRFDTDSRWRTGVVFTPIKVEQA